MSQLSGVSQNSNSVYNESDEPIWDKHIKRAEKVSSAPNLNISLIGNGNVGKTALLNYFAKGQTARVKTR
jgi:GTPase SAR1 family protein